jgi:hypothetical protein
VKGATSTPKKFSLSEIPNHEVALRVVSVDKVSYSVLA